MQLFHQMLVLSYPSVICFMSHNLFVIRFLSYQLLLMFYGFYDKWRQRVFRS